MGSGKLLRWAAASLVNFFIAAVPKLRGEVYLITETMSTGLGIDSVILSLQITDP